MPGSHNVGSITGAHLPSPPHQPGAGAGWGAADYIRLLNISTAKLVAVLTVCLLAGYHALLAATHGVSVSCTLLWSVLALYLQVTPCKGLLSQGMYKGIQWQPWGCMMHRYTLTDTERCFRYRCHRP